MTLVEVIVVTALFGVLMLAVGESIASLYRYNNYTISQAYQVDHARRGLEALVRDVREMGYADDGTFPLARMEEHLIGFYSDIDRDNSVEYVEYELATSTKLLKRIYNATGTPPTYDLDNPDETYTLSEYVQNLNQATSTFYYFDGNGAQVSASSTVTDVQYVEAKIIVNIDPVRDPGEFTLRSSASLRNLKNN